MVNTRRKSHVPTTDDSASQIAEQSDSSTTSVTTRRSTRLSVGSVSVQTPIKEVSTPIRRSRRLSNSSVESTTNNDTPRPATRRSIRIKNTGSDHESSDVELLVIKRRKVVEGVESLGAISEEKNEAERPNQTQGKGENPVVIELENVKEEIKETREKSETPEIFEDCHETHSVDENHGVKVESSIELSMEKIDETEDAKIPQKIVTVNLEESPLKRVTSDINVEVATASEIIPVHEEENKSSEPGTIVEVNETAKESSPVKSEVEKPRLLFGVPANTISIDPKNLIQTIQESQIGGKKKASAGKKGLPRRKFLIEKKVEPAKIPLPCGADIMKNIPRGKCKSGREWKEPKSNPRYLYQDKGLKMPFEKITQLRQERKRVLDLENRLKEEERARRAEIARRREINKKREEENARRGEVVQVVRNMNKIKRMKKKQLKLIQKRDTTKMV